MLKLPVKKALLEALSKANEGPIELAMDGERVKVSCAVLPTIRAGQTGRIRLRFDKVVLRLMRALKGNLGAKIPEGQVVPRRSCYRARPQTFCKIRFNQSFHKAL